METREIFGHLILFPHVAWRDVAESAALSRSSLQQGFADQTNSIIALCIMEHRH